MSVWAVVPAKAFGRAKSRLGDTLAPGRRAALAQGMLEHVLGVLDAAGLAGVAVVTDGDDVAAVARAAGALVVRDPTGAGLAEVVDAGLSAVAARRATRALVVMADLPALVPADIALLRARSAQAELVLAPDQAGQGTNALCVRGPLAVPPQFGHADSLQRHWRAARARGLRVRIARSHGLGLDIDGAADLRAANLAASAAQRSAW